MNRKPLVAILGCGPSGLLAAWACDTARVPFVIFSRPQPSELGGAQYSHIPIPGLTDHDPDVMLTYRVRGSGEEYQKKVYGESSVPFVSIKNVTDGKEVPAWNLRQIYERLWDVYGKLVVETEISPEFMEKMSAGHPFDVIFSSVPLSAICRATIDMDVQHSFRSQPVRIHNAALWEDMPNNTIVYDGTEEHSYYRMSKIFGVGSTEWGATAPLPPVSTKTVSKPIATNCNCFPWVQRIGRFGAWTKGVLTMHAFNSVVDTLRVWGGDM